jgi:adsorption protein B
MTPIYPMYSVSWFLSLAVLIILLRSQISKAIAICNVYGFRSMFFACLFPPIISVRTVWGNLINMTATIKAHKQNMFGNTKTAAKKSALADTSSSKKKKKLIWVKTDHSFLSKEVLKRYHRRLGDVLLETDSVSKKQLKRALVKSKDQKKRLGAYLVENGIITEGVMMEALARTQSIPFVSDSTLYQFNLPNFAPMFSESVLRSLLVVPLLKTEGGFVVAFCEKSAENAREILQRKYQIDITTAYISEEGVLEGLNIMYHFAHNQTQSLIMDLYEQGRINYEQVIIAFNFAHNQTHSRIMDLYEQGLINYDQVIEAFNFKELFRREDADILIRMGLQLDDSADMLWHYVYKLTTPAIRQTTFIDMIAGESRMSDYSRG